jgi:glutamate-ammonia-ligase adenylyltransferase
MPALLVPPLPFDIDRVARALDTLAERGFAPPDDMARALLAGAFGNSGFLVRLALREAASLIDYFTIGPAAIVQAAQLLALAPAGDEAQMMINLRAAKRRAALAIALADIGGVWNFQQVTQALTDLADACVKGALRFLLARMAAQQGFAERDGEILEATTGLTVLGDGKIRRP